ncbi:MAG TPA: alpha/beta hydrolase [Chloroflexia bacterium]|nr:alpha/beta hydrolase [Chloroflexia bacterium]
MNHIPYSYVVRVIENPSKSVIEYSKKPGQWYWMEGGYSAIQSSKPQTLGYGLNDSPSGLAGWLIEKYRSWSDCDGEVEKRFSKDESLANISVYWVTQTITSSCRLYYENGMDWGQSKDNGEERVPTAVAIFPKDILPPPRELVEYWFPGVSVTEMPKGGHFAAFEEPELLAEDLRKFFRPLRLSDGYK